MKNEDNKDFAAQEIKAQELPDAWWYRVYFAVLVTTVCVISALWLFSKYFSS